MFCLSKNPENLFLLVFCYVFLLNPLKGQWDIPVHRADLQDVSRTSSKHFPHNPRDPGFSGSYRSLGSWSCVFPYIGEQKSPLAFRRPKNIKICLILVFPYFWPLDAKNAWFWHENRILHEISSLGTGSEVLILDSRSQNAQKSKMQTKIKRLPKGQRSTSRCFFCR